MMNDSEPHWKWLSINMAEKCVVNPCRAAAAEKRQSSPPQPPPSPFYKDFDRFQLSAFDGLIQGVLPEISSLFIFFSFHS